MPDDDKKNVDHKKTVWLSAGLINTILDMQGKNPESFTHLVIDGKPNAEGKYGVRYAMDYGTLLPQRESGISYSS